RTGPRPTPSGRPSQKTTGRPSRERIGAVVSETLSLFRGPPRASFERTANMAKTNMAKLWTDPDFLAAIQKQQAEGAREPSGQAGSPLDAIPQLHAGAAPGGPAAPAASPPTPVLQSRSSSEAPALRPASKKAGQPADPA